MFYNTNNNYSINYNSNYSIKKTNNTNVKKYYTIVDFPTKNKTYGKF